MRLCERRHTLRQDVSGGAPAQAWHGAVLVKSVKYVNANLSIMCAHVFSRTIQPKNPYNWTVLKPHLVELEPAQFDPSNMHVHKSKTHMASYMAKPGRGTKHVGKQQSNLGLARFSTYRNWQDSELSEPGEILTFRT